MDGLQRSTTSFRRVGSSGLVWDDKNISGELNKVKTTRDHQKDEEKNPRSSSQNRRSRSDREHTTSYRTVKVDFSTPTIDPPSPKVSACGFCGVFGKPGTTQKPKSSKRKS